MVGTLSEDEYLMINQIRSPTGNAKNVKLNTIFVSFYSNPFMQLNKATWRHLVTQIWVNIVKLMDCCLMTSKPLPKPMVT